MKANIIKVKVTYWKNIPVSLMVKGGGEIVSIKLPNIYMNTVDAVATALGETDSRIYTRFFHYEKFEEEGVASDVAERIANSLQEKYSSNWLKQQRLSVMS